MVLLNDREYIFIAQEIKLLTIHRNALNCHPVNPQILDILILTNLIVWIRMLRIKGFTGCFLIHYGFIKWEIIYFYCSKNKSLTIHRKSLNCHPVNPQILDILILINLIVWIRMLRIKGFTGCFLITYGFIEW